jgi:hypothetical protein
MWANRTSASGVCYLFSVHEYVSTLRKLPVLTRSCRFVSAKNLTLGYLKSAEVTTGSIAEIQKLPRANVRPRRDTIGRSAGSRVMRAHSREDGKCDNVLPAWVRDNGGFKIEVGNL